VFNRHGYSLANLLLVVDSVWKKVTRKAYIKISRLEFTGEVNTFYGFAGGQTNQDYCRFQWLTGKEIRRPDQGHGGRYLHDAE
jgi:hypothetical protein